jgi:hypothetical protein
MDGRGCGSAGAPAVDREDTERGPKWEVDARRGNLYVGTSTRFTFPA